MVMSYLIQSNSDYTQRVDEIEEKIDKIVDKLEKFEYNINILSDSVSKELDRVSDILRVASNS